MNVPLAGDRRRLLTVFVCAALAAAGLGLCGCDSPGSTEPVGGQGTAAQPREHPMLQGIPLPIGFRTVPERSVGRASGQLRVGTFEFEGTTSPDEIERFFAQYMPSARFVQKNRRFDNGEYNLRFESDTEECNVRIRRVKTKTVLIVDIGPLPKGPTERDAKPAVRQP